MSYFIIIILHVQIFNVVFIIVKRQFNFNMNMIYSPKTRENKKRSWLMGDVIIMRASHLALSVVLLPSWNRTIVLHDKYRPSSHASHTTLLYGRSYAPIAGLRLVVLRECLPNLASSYVHAQLGQIIKLPAKLHDYINHFKS